LKTETTTFENRLDGGNSHKDVFWGHYPHYIYNLNSTVSELSQNTDTHFLDMQGEIYIKTERSRL